MASPLDLLACDASDLSRYLLEERFEKNRAATLEFLSKCSSSLTASNGVAAEKEEQDDTDWGEELFEAVDVSFVAPRGKMKCSLYENGIKCRTAKNDVLLIRSEVAQQLVLFPKPEDCRKKDARVMVLLDLNEAVTFKKKPLQQLCCALPDSWSTALLEQALQLDQTQVATVGTNSTNKFRSHNEGNTSTTSGGMPFVRCYRGVHDGVLYPMREGLVFYK